MVEFMVTPRIPHPAHFDFGRSVSDARLHFRSRSVDLTATRLNANVQKVELSSPDWSPEPSHAVLTPPDGPESPSSDAFQLRVTNEAHLVLESPDGEAILEGHTTGSFGICGDDWMLRLEAQEGDTYYGLGEKWGPLEKTGERTIFWNSDVWADFDPAEIERMRCDPIYASIPYLIIKRGETYVGILLDTPYPAFASIRSVFEFHRPEEAEAELFLGARGGAPAIYVLVGPTLKELTRALQRLVGTTPRPPLWALGHHQSRWGYAGSTDLENLDESFEKHDVPCDGLWLDIDYMDRFKAFTLDPHQFQDAETTLAKLRAKGRRIVPILDPGVKVESGYPVYDAGLERGMFCTTREGTPYVGIVWPGKVHFPDFARKEARSFWSEQVTTLARRGFSGFWIDMNDPSTGGSDPEAMRFDAGRLAHAAYRNQYALGMAQATFSGLAEAFPERRPFVLTRSASPSMSRYAAVWTGDNLSSEVHLAASIPTSINLALSGIPFNGPDVPGFGGDATDDLMVRWYKAGFLFPFLRNHSCQGTRRQEPWAFSKSTLSIVRHYIKLRYKLMPYLYNLFIEQERSGDAILRPLFYDFDSSEALPLENVADQFMIGPALMQAPLLSQKAKKRGVILPEATWLDAVTGAWLPGGKTLEVSDGRRTTPLFIRGGTVIPMRRKVVGNVPTQLDDIELHVFLQPSETQTQVSFRYEFDAGEGFDYREGISSSLSGNFERRGNALSLNWDDVQLHAGGARLTVVTYSGEDTLHMVTSGKTRSLPMRPKIWNMVGGRLSCQKSPILPLRS